MKQYCHSITSYKRFKTREVKVGSVIIGGNQPIVLQSMTTSDTMNTNRVIEECIEIIEAGGQLIRLTTPSIKEAAHLEVIKQRLTEKGYTAPLIADVHFTPNAAETAAEKVDKVRINPGNYAEKKIKSGGEYSDKEYHHALSKIKERFLPLLQICATHQTAIRIGTNHGSLSDRILSKFGDTPRGMVESAMEFVRICAEENFHNIVISMKSSNPIVMIQAYRLLVATMIEEGYDYPLHLGVTEAGDGEDGRIKSAIGIGSLLEDGIGDTIRVSLTEPAAHEIPVAQKIATRYRSNNTYSDYELFYNPYEYEKRSTFSIANIGSEHVPIVIQGIKHHKTITHASFFPFGYRYRTTEDKWDITDSACDYIIIQNQIINFAIPGNLGIIQDFETWKIDGKTKERHYPLLTINELKKLTKEYVSTIYFIDLEETEINDIRYISQSEYYKNCVIIYHPKSTSPVYSARYLFAQLNALQIKTPVILHNVQETAEIETFQLNASIETGSLLIDGFGDGVYLNAESIPQLDLNSTSFGILQATRTRISKTEYISCPSCGRTLFDLQETTLRIKKATQHLKGLKIGIMGCIVNGPGEMADADYGYVGSGVGKINLYKKKEIVKRNVPTEKAVEELIEIIKLHDDWVEQ